jgi:hypothetical protein
MPSSMPSVVERGFPNLRAVATPMLTCDSQGGWAGQRTTEDGRDAEALKNAALQAMALAPRSGRAN